MKRKLLTTVVIAAILIAAGCKKNTDNASLWVGTYNSTGSPVDSLNQLIISEVNSTTVTIQLQAHYGAFLYTFATLQHATVVSATSLTFNESDSLNISPVGIHLFNGTATLGGNNITLAGTASNDSLPIQFSFTGSK